MGMDTRILENQSWSESEWSYVSHSKGSWPGEGPAPDVPVACAVNRFMLKLGQNCSSPGCVQA